MKVFNFDVDLFSEQDAEAQQLDDDVEEVGILMPKVNPDGKDRAEIMKQQAQMKHWRISECGRNRRRRATNLW